MREATFIPSLLQGAKVFRPIQYSRRVEKRGWLRWFWVIECEFSKLSNGPYWTRVAAERDMARFTP